MDDDELINLLREALAVDEEVSPRMAEAAVSAVEWLRVDDEMAELVFDSADSPALATVRGDVPRQLTYRFDDLLIDCEVGHDALLGQLVPAALATLELLSADGARTVLDVDDTGGFVAESVPAGPMSIRCSRVGQPTVVTPWLLV